MKELQGNWYKSTIFNQVRLSYLIFKIIEIIEPKPSKQDSMPQLSIPLGHM
jgi:hypothetical protein